ncbi:tannase/feruloyl esterase family alpha/beta hydrolase [Variovorax sp.]|jgi:Tannase and feruloyl esterase|uniref:tannase/feruloyl esterase family alpha/beta hydrolase n=1 Tax=Variovorax sp. TaxID=1871043 RepID=UPI001209101B|nr:tannase/feruloyl esterase family alpha/beta hydrolase [Variovorax sp.]TAJ68373.1 MAG: tannase/feruloyl esterase family alpha/beta hydrolase [Variovorax sp.]
MNRSIPFPPSHRATRAVPRIPVAATLAAAALLSACGGSGNGVAFVPQPSVPAPAPAPAAATPLNCEQMAKLSVPASAIALATGGAKVTAATLVPAGGKAPKSHGEYCQLSAEIAPVDPAAPPIKLTLLLPTEWNRKAMMYGGGGYDGSIPVVAGNVPAGPVDALDPVGRGYAVFGSDSGHDATTDPANLGAFALNTEALRNFSFEALKKTRDAAVFLIEQRYAQRPQRSYFAGGSSGGREALAVVQKWPTDFNGAIVLYPAFNAASLDLQFGRITRALAQPGAYPSLAKRGALFDAAMQACDALDGVKDGLIGNQNACNQRFDPATALLDGKPLRCPGGADTADDCLSDAQIAAFKVIDTPAVFNYPLGSGENQYPGFNAWGAEFGRSGIGQTTVAYLGLGAQPPASPMPAFAPFHSNFWDQWVRFFVTKNPAFDSLTLDPENPGPWQARIAELTQLQDINQADLSAFAANGGKLLMAHGTADQLVSTRATDQYFNRVRATMGAERVKGFMRYYQIPGYAHAVGTVFNASWDSLSALENWVEKDAAPTTPIVADTAGVPGRTRPLCDYPAWPKYKGSGDVNLAASFSCVNE